MDILAAGAIIGSVIMDLTKEDGADSDYKSIFGKVLDMALKNDREQRRLMNHDLQRAVLRSFYKALEKILADFLLKHEPRLGQFNYDHAQYTMFDQKIKSKLEELKQDPAPSSPLDCFDELKILVTPEGYLDPDKVIQVKDNLIEQAVADLGNIPPEYKKELEKSLFTRVCEYFTLEVKYTPQVTNIFQVQLQILTTEQIKEVNLRLSGIEKSIARQNHRSTPWKMLTDNDINKRPSLENCQSYYRGSNLSSWNVVRYASVSRQATALALDLLRNKDFVLILGAGGEGKTTCLRQIALELFSEGYKVFYAIKSRINLDVDSVYDIIEDYGNKIVFVIDNADEVTQLRDILQYLNELNLDIKVILAARKNEWLVANIDLGEIERAVEIVPLEGLNEEEAEQLALRLINSKTVEDCDVAQLARNLLKESNQFLLAAMLIATQGKDLKKIVNDVVKRISKFTDGDKLLTLLGLVSMFEINLFQCNDPFCSRELLKKMIRMLGISENRAKKAFKSEVLNLEVTGKKVTTRHPVIARLIYEAYEDFDISEYEIHYNILKAIGILEDEDCYNIKLLVNIPQYSVEKQGYNTDTAELFQLSTEINPSYVKVWEAWIRAARKANRIGDYKKRNTARHIVKCAMEKASNDFGLWNIWLEIETCEKNIGNIGQENSVRWIYKKFTNEHPLYSAAWLRWARMEERELNIGTLEEENTARWIYREGLRENPKNYELWLGWAKLEEAQQNIGSAARENTARWIYREGSKVIASIYHLWFGWARLEEQEKNIGTVDQENTARWIYREGLKKTNFQDHALWLGWARLEEQEQNIGTVDQENTARWIYRKGIEKTSSNVHKLWFAWAKLEEQEQNIGTVDQENTARWIYREGIEKTNSNAHNLWFGWARLEEQEQNIGTVDQENTARWIYREGLEKTNSQVHELWHGWARLEENHKNIGSIGDKNTARWIYSEGLKANPKNYNLCLAWAKLEENQKNIGSIEEENTARWIYSQGLKLNNSVFQLWFAWARLEARQKNIGTVDEENSARWLFNQGLKINSRSVTNWTGWANVEEEQGNIGDLDQENSARWLYSRAVAISKTVDPWLQWHDMEKKYDNDRAEAINKKITELFGTVDRGQQI